MPITIIERQKSIDENLTILMTLTSTLTVSSLPASLIPTTTRKTKSSSSSTRSIMTSAKTSSSVQPSSKPQYLPKTLLSIPSALVSKISLKPDSTHNLARSTRSSHPLRSNLDNVAGISQENKSLKLGLAIGIPVTIISILIGIILIWYYIKKKTFHKRRNGLLPYKSEYFDHNDNEKLTMNETKFRASSSNLVSTKFQHQNETPLQIQRGPNQQIAHTSAKNFINRLSRTVNIRNVNDTDLETLNENKTGLMSPIFLKKFNLRKSVSRPSDVYNSEERLKRTNGLLRTIDADFLSIPYNDSKISINERRCKKPLPKLPPIIDTYKSKSLHDMENVVTHILLPSANINNPHDIIYKVIKPYVKNLDDEISIKLGDKVRILKEHSDGWCFIRLTEEWEHSNAKLNQGVIPRLCLEKN